MAQLTSLFYVFCLIAVAASQDPQNTCYPNTGHTGYAPDPVDCNAYYACYNGEFLGAIRECNIAGFNFDVLKARCALNAVCFPGLDPNCDSVPGKTRVPSKGNCRQFYNCENEGQLETCPEDTPFFDTIQAQCQKDSASVVCYPTSSKVDLNPPTEPVPTTTEEPEEPLSTTEEPEEPPTTTEEPTEPPTTTEEPTEPPSTTEEPKPSINTCQPNIGYIDPLPHPTDCDKRVYCENGEVVSESSCINGWIFDYVFLSCIANGHCFPGETISCANPGSTQSSLVPHPKYCRQYYDCSSADPREHKVGKACQDPTPFFDYRQERCGTTEEVLCYPGSSRDIPPPTDKTNFLYLNN